MPEADKAPRLQLGHATLAAKDLDSLSAFYSEVLGFQVTDRGPVGPDGGEIAFLSQDPRYHHQIAMVSGVPTPDHAFMMVEHLAFRTGSLDDLRELQTRLEAAEIKGVLQISHGNAWSLYFDDPEGNGVECFVDSPFHVAQPFAKGFDLSQGDDEILESTRELLQGEPDFGPMEEWRQGFVKSLDGD